MSIDESDSVAVEILVVPEREAETVVREAVAQARRLGVDITPAQVDVLPARVASQEGQRRKIAQVATSYSESLFTARVTLQLGGDLVVGEGQTVSGLGLETRAVAHAVVEAVKTILPEPLAVADVDRLRVGGEELIVVTIRRPAGTLVGSAVLGSDPFDATARAAMKAVNGVLERRSW